MVLYNSFADLVAGQFVVVVLVGCVGVLLGTLVTRARPSGASVLLALAVAVVVTVASSAVGTGGHSGMMYRERLGWPVAWFTVLRNIEIGTDVAVPFARELDPLRFAANAAFWGVAALLALSLRRAGRPRLIAAATLGLMAALTVGFSVLNGTGRPGEVPVDAATASSPSTVSTEDAELVAAKRAIIERTFPEFADFENQPSFAGTSVKVVEDDGEYWFAYIVHGSGLPIAQATCFRADLGTAYMVGEFPDPLDSYAGYRDIDPRTCRGIK